MSMSQAFVKIPITFEGGDGGLAGQGGAILDLTGGAYGPDLAVDLSGTDPGCASAFVAVPDVTSHDTVTFTTAGTLTDGVDTTTSFDNTAAAADIQTALEAFASIGAGNVVVTGAAGTYDLAWPHQRPTLTPGGDATIVRAADDAATATITLPDPSKRASALVVMLVSASYVDHGGLAATPVISGSPANPFGLDTDAPQQVVEYLPLNVGSQIWAAQLRHPMSIG